jgi:hypothetical protein
MLIHEDGRGVHLAQGVPADWLSRDGLCIRVKKAPIQHGFFDYEARREGKTLWLRVLRTNAGVAAKKKIRFYLPDGLEAAAVKIDGKASEAVGRRIEIADWAARECRVEISLR